MSKMLAKHLCRVTISSRSKILFFVLCIINIFVLTSASFAEFSGGNGTKASPYLIANTEDIKQLALVLGNDKTAGNSIHDRKYYQIAKDIDLKNEDFVPIANFSGCLDGDGHVIKNLNITSNPSCGSHYGMFGNLTAAEIKNLSVTGHIIINNDQTDNYKKLVAGGIAGSARDGTQIINCEFNGTVQAQIPSDGNKSTIAGGIVGEINGSIESCKFAGYVISVSGNNNSGALAFAGGIAGSIDNNDKSCYIKNCTSQAEISANGSSNNAAGGIVGQANVADEHRFYGNLYALNKTTVYGIGNVILLNGIENQHSNTGCSAIDK
jgi:hypothetical protein